VQELVAAYQAACAAGQTPDLHELLARHPEVADQLRARLTPPQAVGAPQTVAPGRRPFGRPPTPSAEAPTLDPEEPAAGRPTPPCEAPTLEPVGPAAGQPTPSPEAPTLEAEGPAGGQPTPYPVPTLEPEGPAGGTTAPPGPHFGDYELLEEIARGGMGVVYKARQKSLHRIVALKMILAGQLASPEQVRRFRIEAEEAGSLDHPNIVPIYQVGEEQGQHYFTMKLIEGGNLGDQIPRFQQDLRAAAQLVATAAQAVHYAHQRGVLHRDLKPGNILLDAQGQPHLTDFGLAKHLGGCSGDTRSGAILGTPGYMAPEQAAACKDLSTAADVYGLGAILYHLLTGRPPFEAATPLDTLLKALEQEPVHPRSLNVRIDRDLEIICLSCLAKEPQRRYASAEALARDLERYLAGEPIRARPVSTRERLLKWVRRRPAAAALLAVSALALITLVLSGWWYSVHLHAALHDADEQRLRAEEGQQDANRERQVAEERRQEANRERQVAEERRQEAEDQRRLAQAHAAEARQQRERAQQNFQKRLEVIDDILINMDDRLAKEGAPTGLRLEFLNEALQLSQGLLKEQRSDPAARRQTSRVYRCIGDLYRTNFAEADKAYGQALGLQDALVAEFPDNPVYRNDLALTQARRARLLQTYRRWPDAQDAYRKAIALQDQVATKAPTQPIYQEHAARYLFALANLFEEARQPREAEQAYRQVLQRQEKLVAAYPNQATYQHDLGITADSLGTLLADSNPTETQYWLERTLQAQRQALLLAPNVEAYGSNLRETYTELAALLKRRGQHADLVRLAGELRRDFPDSGGDSYNACCFVAGACQVARDNRQLSAEARQRLVDDYGNQAVALLDKSIKEGYVDRAHMDKDADLDPLRGRPDFQKLLTDLDKRFPLAAQTPAKELETLVQEYSTALRYYQYYTRNAQRVAEKKKAAAKKPDFQKFAQSLLQLAEKHPEASTAVDALVMVLTSSVPTGDSKEDAARAALRERALGMLQQDHFQKAEIAGVCQRLVDHPVPDADKLLRAALEKHAKEEVRGLAGFALASSYAQKAEQAGRFSPTKAAALAEQAEQQLEQVIAKYAAVPYGSTTLGEAAKTKLYELRHLSIGRVAPEIEGEDLDGKALKLSAYRGQVVVIDFWANWCGWCRQMYPHERDLVKRLKGQPFALLGINCDDDRAEVRRVVQKQQLSWPSWWDGGRAGGRITKQWQIESFPRIFVLDPKGVIRYKDVRGADLDAAVDQLLKEHAAALQDQKK
jgi:thiol-disulfide isomerase/thioredoxin/tRNA A-37 threonylcarbamoyl transferase component Bud32